MSHLMIFDRDQLPEPETLRPNPGKVIEGDPVFTLWTLDQDAPGQRFTGLWHSTKGAWRVSYDEWEYCALIEGEAIITEDGVLPRTLKAGHHVVFQPGFKGSWQVVEPVLKSFVVLLPETCATISA